MTVIVTRASKGTTLTHAEMDANFDNLKATADSAASVSSTHVADTLNPHVVTKAQVGLGNADNTSDADKPVSTAQGTAIDLKEDAANKSTSVVTDQASDTKFPSVKAVYDWVVGVFTGKTSSTGSDVLPVGSTAQRDGTPAAGYTRVNSDTELLEYYAGSAWKSADVAGDTHAATSKADPDDADEIPLADSAASFVLKKLTWANLKATVKAALEATGMTFAGPVLFDTVADIASATSIDLTAYGSGFIATVTGTTPIEALVMSDGQFGTLVAEGLLPFTYHATTANVYGGVSVTAYAGQLFDVSKTGGVVRIVPRMAKNIAFSVNKGGTAQSIPHATYTKLTWSTEELDTHGTFASDKWIPGVIGPAHVNLAAYFDGAVDGLQAIVAVYRNGTIYRSTITRVGAAAGSSALLSTDVVVGAVDDYFEVYVYHAAGGAVSVTGATNSTYFNGHTV